MGGKQNGSTLPNLVGLIPSCMIVSDDAWAEVDEFKRIFAGNSDDNFRLGLKITRKAIKLFSDFFSSDIIVASPLGLRTVGEKSK